MKLHFARTKVDYIRVYAKVFQLGALSFGFHLQRGDRCEGLRDNHETAYSYIYIKNLKCARITWWNNLDPGTLRQQHCLIIFCSVRPGHTRWQ